MSDGRKWEDLEFECLVNILCRVGTESLVLDVPFVCKSWYKASLNLSCWQHVDFRGLCDFWSPKVDFCGDENRCNDFAFNELMISMVARGLRKTTSLVLPRGYNDVLLELGEGKICPELKSLSMNIDFTDNSGFIESLGKWKLLEELRLEGEFYYIDFPKLVAVIGQNCMNFNCLTLSYSVIRDEYALAIAAHLQKIKKLIMVHCFIEQENLETIVLACKDLELLEVNKCQHSNTWEEKKLRSLGSHIKTLNLDASYCSHSNDEYDDGYQTTDFDLGSVNDF